MKKINKNYLNSYEVYNSSPTQANQIINQSITLNDSDSDSDIDYSQVISPNNNNNIINIYSDHDEKNKNSKFLGNKHKSQYFQDLQKNKINQNLHEHFININNFNHKSPKKLKKSNYLLDSNNNNNSPIFLPNKSNNINYNKNRPTKKINKIKSRKNIIRINDIDDEEEYEEDEEGEVTIVKFPYEFTKNVIEALTCEYCQGIYIRPYVINLPSCMHIFCLGCILKMLEDKEIGLCFKCFNQFFLKNIKYSEVTDFYIKTFFPQIPIIIEGNKKLLNDFMISEAKKNFEVKEEDEKKIVLKCELKPNKQYVPPQKRLPEIVNNHYKFMIDVKSENENIVSILKKQTLKRINIKLREEDLELRCGDTELSLFTSYKVLKKFLKPNLNGIITFFYNKK